MITINGNALAGSPILNGNAPAGSPVLRPRPEPFPYPRDNGWLRAHHGLNQYVPYVSNYRANISQSDWLCSTTSWSASDIYADANPTFPDYAALQAWFANERPNMMVGGCFASSFVATQAAMDAAIALDPEVAYNNQPKHNGYYATPLRDPILNDVTSHGGESGPNPDRPGAKLARWDLRHVQDYLIQNICDSAIYSASFESTPFIFIDDWGFGADVPALYPAMTVEMNIFYASRVRHALNSIGRLGVFNWGHGMATSPAVLGNDDLAISLGRACDCVMFEQDTLESGGNDLTTGTLYEAHVRRLGLIADQGSLIYNIVGDGNSDPTEARIEMRFYAATMGFLGWRGVVYYLYILAAGELEDWFDWPEVLGRRVGSPTYGSTNASCEFERGRLDIDLTTREVTLTV